MQSKYWVFTENATPDAFRNTLETLIDNAQISYICGQLEEAAHRHFQGYVQLTRSHRLSWLKNNISETAHWEKQQGTNEQARDYCRKEDDTTIAGTFVEYGQFQTGRSGRGARNDLAELRDAIKQGQTQRQIIENNELVQTYATYLRYHDRVRSLYKPSPRENGVEVILFVGDPGTGKTRRAYEEYPDLFETPISNGTLWLDGYDDHPHVLYDDFMGKGSKMTLDNTLKFLDRYVRAVPIKGSHAWYRPEVIIVTSNYHPRHWYDWSTRPASWAALKRRFHRIVFFHDNEQEEIDDMDNFLEDTDFWPAPVVEYYDHNNRHQSQNN